MAPEVKYVDVVTKKFHAHKTLCCGAAFTRIDGISVCDHCGKNVGAELVFHMKAVVQEQADLIAD